jgi:hypothetical protein
MNTQIIDEHGQNTTVQKMPVGMNSRMADLKRRASQQTESTGELWQPNDGDMLVGVIMGTEITHTRLYGEQNLLVVQDDSGAIVKTWLTKWLQTQLHSQGGEVGDLMALTFGGKKVTKAGRNFNAYTLVVDKV